ncbi:MAG TPA: hypothetical protein VFR40_12725 [Lapillicoccus sp.]|nr:hypothetical protein [Lapillicoccus sp.]
MSFVQLIAFHADDVTGLVEGETEWLAATAGRRTLQHTALYRDVHDPRHYVAYNAFPDREAAALNSALPETDALAGRIAATFGAPTFTDLELVGDAWDATDEIADRFRSFMESSGEREADVVAPDATLVMLFPHFVGEVTGRTALVHGLLEESAGRTFDRYEHQPTRDGFLVDYAYRTLASDSQPSLLSVGLVAVTVEAGRVARGTITCSGSWDAEREAEIYGRTPAVV